MPDEPPAAFVDSNVVVYAYDDTERRRQPIAVELLTQLVDDDRLRLSTQVLQEFYVTVTGKVRKPIPHDAAVAVMDDLSAWPIQEIDYAAIRSAAVLSREKVLSFWDALIVVAASRSDAEILFSEDLTHGQVLLGVRIEDPFRDPDDRGSDESAADDDTSSETTNRHEATENDA